MIPNTSSSASQSPVSLHFDEEAKRYDFWKKRNWYYYQTIKEMYGSLIKPEQTVLEVGCGTGDILAGLTARRRVGIDISPEMIGIAKKKYPSIEWHAGTTGQCEGLQGPFDVVFLSDVIEHLEDVNGTFRDLRTFCHPSTTVLINMANPLWEPILMLLEKLHMKMPEGPHTRITTRQLTDILQKNGYVLISRKKCMLFPTFIPVLTPCIRFFERLPLINSLCLIELLQYEVR